MIVGRAGDGFGGGRFRRINAGHWTPFYGALGNNRALAPPHAGNNRLTLAVKPANKQQHAPIVLGLILVAAMGFEPMTSRL
jgi:hypothetical protein